MLDFFIEKLKKQEQFIFTKFGDGEAICMSNNFPPNSTNCDGQIYSTDLAEKLIESAKHLSTIENVFVGQWVFDVYSEVLNGIFESHNCKFNYVDYALLIHTNYNDLEKLKKFYRELKNNKLKKVYICPSRLNKANKFLDSSIYNVKEKDCFSDYEETKNNLINSDFEIFLYSCGLMSKVLISEILKHKKNSIHIDIGSGLDNLFFGKTRADQVSKRKLRKFYSI